MDTTDLAYWFNLHKDMLKTKNMKIINDGLSEYDLYFWLLYQASKIKIKLDMESEREQISSRLRQLDKFIEDNRKLAEEETVYSSQDPIPRKENYRM